MNIIRVNQRIYDSALTLIFWVVGTYLCILTLQNVVNFLLPSEENGGEEVTPEVALR